jgi:hypothetical protein
MRRVLAPVVLLLVLAGCFSASGKCQSVPASFFTDIGTRGQITKSGAVKSHHQTANGHALYEVAAKFTTGEIAVWSTGIALTHGGPTYPMNQAARSHSDQGVDAPISALPNDPHGVDAAVTCVV